MIEEFVIDILYSTFIDSEFMETDPASGRRHIQAEPLKSWCTVCDCHYFILLCFRYSLN